jgi:hypothetical protein
MMLAPPAPRHISDLDLGARIGLRRMDRRMMSDEDVWPVSDTSLSSFADSDEEHAAERWARSVVEPFRDLRQNWDSYGGYPVSSATAEIGVGVLTWIALLGVSLPQTFPTSDGGLSIEWHRPDLDFVISLPPPDVGVPPTAYFRLGHDESEMDDLRVPDGRLEAAMAALAGAYAVAS